MSTAPTKLPHASLAEVREHDGSAESIRQAFFRLDDARAEATAEIARIEHARPATLLTSSVSEIDRADEKARRLKIFIEQLDLLEPELKSSFVAAKVAEQDAEYAEKLAAIEVTIREWNADVQHQYPKIVAPLLSLLERERAIRAACVDIVTMPTHRRLRDAWAAPGSPADQLQLATMARHGCPGLRASLADLVRLPGLEPGDATWGHA